MRKVLLNSICTLVFLLSFVSFAQEVNYERINIQGQLINETSGSVDLEVVITSVDDEVIWKEIHNGIELYSAGAFTIAMGDGTFVEGSVPSFDQINWFQVSEVEIYRAGDEPGLIGNFQTLSVPYSMHSLSVERGPHYVGLVDVSESFSEGSPARFNGVTFSWADGGDISTEFAHYSDTADYASETALADSVPVVNFSPGNWALTGNAGLDDTHFAGSKNAADFVFRTNNTPRLTLGNDYAVHNGLSGPGLRFNPTKSGILFTPGDINGMDTLNGSYLYFEGKTFSFHGGTNDDPKDTLKGEYSFTWGHNVGTNGTYSTIFGKDSYGDTSFFGGAGTPYAAISSFAMGRNCRVARMGVAIGDSAVANYYRNTAIGKNVIATQRSSGTAIGNNVLVTGATSWAMGNNVQATGSFSTGLGTNASTNDRLGSFVYGDNSTSDTLRNTTNNQFMVRADGGYVFYSSTDLSNGVTLAPGGGSWSMISDRSKKNAIVGLNPLDFQQAFKSLGVFSWNYKGVPVGHVGPMAQDFYQTFGVGELPRYINMIDSDGVTFLGAKMINKRLEALPKKEEVNEAEQEIIKEKEALDDMQRRINLMYEKLDHN